jgi:Methyltransferase domain
LRTAIQKWFAPLKSILPDFLSTGIRAVVTAFATPFVFSSWSGHFKSSLRGVAITPGGRPIPWYTFPCVHFLERRTYADKVILEFGGGQSTLWWAARAKHVITIEQDKDWHAHLKKMMPANVSLHLVNADADGVSPSRAEVTAILNKHDGNIDVAVIDGNGNRKSLVEVVRTKLASDGAIVCDDASEYGFYEVTQGVPMQRLDFYGHQSAVVLPNCTSIFFNEKCFLFGTQWPIDDIARTGFATDKV